jgi:hypothetical protein
MDILVELLCHGRSFSAAMASPRMHTEGGRELEFSAGVSQAHREYLAQIGYQVGPGKGANANGIARDPESGRLTVLPPPEE